MVYVKDGASREVAEQNVLLQQKLEEAGWMRAETPAKPSSKKK